MSAITRLQAMKDKIQDATRIGVEAGIKVIQFAAQNEVPVKTGNLKSKILVRTEESPGRVRGVCYVDLNSAPYGAEVEYGSSGLPEGVILPKKGKFLVFEIDGKTIFTKAVFQPGHPYMRPAFDQFGNEAIEKAKDIIRGELSA